MCLAVLLALSTFTETLAYAEPEASLRELVRSEPERQGTARTPMRWYGWQILAIDVTSYALVAGAVSEGKQNPTAGVALLSMGLAAAVLGGPVVHLAHRHVGRAIGSFVLRLLAPTFFLIPALIRDPCTACDNAGPLPPHFIPFWFPLAVTAAVATPFIDGFALGYEPKHEARTPTLSFAPISCAGRVGLSLSLTHW